MRPPKGFEDEKFPLLHRLINATGLGLDSAGDKNTVLFPLIMHSNEMDVNASAIIVNPHNTAYVSEVGPLCRKMSIIDRLTISLKFSMTKSCQIKHETAAGTFLGDDIAAIKFLWRPIFNIFPEKLDAADDDTGTTVAAILGLTKDATFEDVVPVTTNKLPVVGPSNTNLAVSNINAVQVFDDFNMTTNVAMEDHVFDEDLLQTALRRYTNKGALRSCLGRTRHVTLTRKNPVKNFYLDKPVPSAIRRIQPYSFFGIQVHMPEEGAIDQIFATASVVDANEHMSVQCIANYHEWNFEHEQQRTVDI